MNHFYLAPETWKPNPKMPKNPGTCFNRPMDLTLKNVCDYCFGHHGLPHTAIKFKDGYRKKANFQESDVYVVDIDGLPCGKTAEELPSDKITAETWKAAYKPLFKDLKLHVIVYPSKSFKAHAFVFMNHKEIEKNNYESELPALFAMLLKACPQITRGAKGQFSLDTADKDAARALAPGAGVDNPEEWAFEINGPEVDVDELLKSPLLHESDNNHLPLQDLIEAANTLGSRNTKSHDVALNSIAHNTTEAAARDDFMSKVGNNGLDKDELERIFKNALKADTVSLGCDLKEDKGAKRGKKGQSDTEAEKFELATALQELTQWIRFRFRRAVQDPYKSTSQGRLSSNQIYSIYDNEECSEINAHVITAAAYTSAIIKEVEKRYENNPVLMMKIKSVMGKQLNIDILTNDGLIFPHENQVFFRNGILEITGSNGEEGEDWKFTPLQENQLLVNKLPFDFTLDPRLIRIGLKTWANVYYPKHGEKTFLSPEAAIVIDFLRSALGRVVDDQQALVVNGPGGNGKTTGWHRDIKTCIGSPIFSYMESDFFKGKADTFDWKVLQGCSIGFNDELETGGNSRLDGAIFKKIISKGDMAIEEKFGQRWNEQKFFKVVMTTNVLPTFSDFVDNGLTRKLRAVYVSQRLDKTSPDLPPLTQEQIDGIRAFLCACLVMPSLKLTKYCKIWQDYPLRKQWLEEGNEKGLFSDMLRQADNPRECTEVIFIQGLLEKARRPLGKKSEAALSRMLEAAGYPVKRNSKGRHLVKGYVINEQSTIKQLADNLTFNPPSVIDDGNDDNSTFEKDRQKYIQENLEALNEYFSHFEALLRPEDRKPHTDVTLAPIQRDDYEMPPEGSYFDDEEMSDVEVADMQAYESGKISFDDLQPSSSKKNETSTNCRQLRSDEGETYTNCERLKNRESVSDCNDLNDDQCSTIVPFPQNPTLDNLNQWRVNTLAESHHPEEEAEKVGIALAKYNPQIPLDQVLNKNFKYASNIIKAFKQGGGIYE